MSTDTLDTEVRTTRHRPQWLRATQWLFTRTFFLMFLAWALVVVVVTVVLAIVGRNVDTVQMSGFAISHHGLLWFPFSIAIMMATTYLPLHVAAGMTRRSFIRAALLAQVGIGVLNAVFSTVALLLERWIYDRLGWVHGQTDDTNLTVFAGGELTYGLGLALLFASAMVSGLLVGAAYLRAGAWWGTLALPLTLLPILVTTLVGLGEHQWRPWSITLADHWPGGGPLSAVVVLLAGAVCFGLLVRRIPIETRKT